VTESTQPIEKLETGIPGFDVIAAGGLPQGRVTLVCGTSGSAKTIMAVQFLVEGIKRGEKGVFVTFEESPEDIRRNVAGFGWDLRRWEGDGDLAFVDVSPRPDEEPLMAGSYDLTGLLSRIAHAVNRIGAARLSMDSVGAILTRLDSLGLVRSELLRIASTLKSLGVTSMMTTERSTDYGEVARFGVEEFVADNIVILRNGLTDEKRRRTAEIVKFRGTPHQKGEYPFTVLPGQGLVIIPLSDIELGQKSTDARISSGIPDLDRMCGGGFFRDSIILVSGPTGTGKTLMATHFLADGVQREERCVLFAFEESREQFFRNARGWGMDYLAMEREGRLRVHCAYPEARSVEDHLVRLKEVVEEFQPNRVAVDSLSALERVASHRGFREFVLALTSFIKDRQVAGIFTATTPSLMGGSSVTEAHISTITDSIILLRYVELHGDMRRGLTLLKMRGSYHEKCIREYSIDSRGMQLGRPFRGVTGILSGHSVQLIPSEMERLEGLFADQVAPAALDERRE